MGIEPTYPAWKAGVLPLNYTRKSFVCKLFSTVQWCIERYPHNAQSRNRTSDTRIFSPLLYQLSYLGVRSSFPYPHEILLPRTKNIVYHNQKNVNPISEKTSRNLKQKNWLRELPRSHNALSAYCKFLHMQLQLFRCRTHILYHFKKLAGPIRYSSASLRYLRCTKCTLVRRFADIAD